MVLFLGILNIDITKEDNAKINLTNFNFIFFIFSTHDKYIYWINDIQQGSYW